jgi:hypothetical protein
MESTIISWHRIWRRMDSRNCDKLGISDIFKCEMIKEKLYNPKK